MYTGLRTPGLYIRTLLGIGPGLCQLPRTPLLRAWVNTARKRGRIPSEARTPTRELASPTNYRLRTLGAYPEYAHRHPACPRVLLEAANFGEQPFHALR